MDQKAILLLEKMVSKLDKAILLLAINATLNKKQPEQIECLNRVGFTPKEIAEIIGTTPNTVRVALTYIRKKKR